MGEQWITVARRLLTALEPGTVLDVGEGDGRFLDEVCAASAVWGGTVVAVRPDSEADPHSDRDDLEAANLELRSPYSPATVIDAGPGDLVILHGEPNWWTTAWQLEAVAVAARESGRTLPAILIARAGSPWGRRDCYREPEVVPSDARQPHARLGDAFAALEQGTARNGVLTAVEDFARDNGGLDVLFAPGYGGVAMVVESDAELSEGARVVLDELRLGPETVALIEHLDEELQDQRARATGEEAEAELAALRDRVGVLARELAAARVRAERADARTIALQRESAAAVAATAARAARRPRWPTAVDRAEGIGKLSEEPTRELVRAILQPAEMLAGLGWPEDEEELALPIPVDLRGVIDASAAHSLIVVAEEDSLALRRSLCSIIDRTAAPVAVTIVTSGAPAGAMERTLRAITAATPAIEYLSAAELRPRAGAQRLSAGQLLPWGWPEGSGPREVLHVAYLLPGMPRSGSGGVLSVVQEARGLRRLGAGARACVPEGALERAGRIYGNADGLFVGYARDGLIGEAVGPATVAVATEHTSVPLLGRLARDRPDLTLAYYVQDYEPLFAELGSPRSDRALLSYGAVAGATLYAKTDFVRNVVMARHGIHVAKVEPSLDRELFSADRPKRLGATVTVVAMVRPSTPRRRPAATLKTLSLIHAELGDDATIMTLGCDVAELDQIGDGRWGHVHHLGLLRPDEMAEQLRRCDIFIDASAYQGFGRAGLEAMACGAVPVLPALGGVHEYAADDENAIVLEDERPRAIAEAVLALLRDEPRLQRLQAAGVETATRFSVEQAARSQLELFRTRLARSDPAARDR